MCAQLRDQGGDVISASEKAALEAKYKDELNELEGVMKQTWEDKAAMSKQYEEDRARLEVRGAGNNGHEKVSVRHSR